MATTVATGGSNYSVPAYTDTGWAQGAGNLSAYLVALASTKLDTSGGAFTLTADANFGASFGLVSVYLKSVSANIAASGVLRLASGDSVAWRDNANGADILLSKNTSDQLKWGSSFIVTSASGAAPVENRASYIAGTASGSYTGSLTLVNLPAAYVANGINLRVYINGLLARVTRDYTETSTTSFTFTSPIVSGDSIDALWTTY